MNTEQQVAYDALTKFVAMRRLNRTALFQLLREHLKLFTKAEQRKITRYTADISDERLVHMVDIVLQHLGEQK